jgi:hypothetical protein
MVRRPAAWPGSARTSARAAAALALGLLLAGCAVGGAIGVDSDAPQPFPANHSAEIVAFLRTYLNDPAGLRDAALAEPVERPLGGRVRWVSCVRFTPPRGRPQELAIVHVDGRLDRVASNAAELCTGVVHAPFPELEKLSR